MKIPLDSNIVMAGITLLVGCITLFIYYKEKHSKKRDVAKLILQEVRYAENKIKEYRSHRNYKLHYRLLPTNNWNANIHLFITDFEQSEVDLISSFYSQAGYIDCVIQKISDDKLSPPKVEQSQSTSTNISQQPTSQQDFSSAPQLITIMFPPIAQDILEETSVSIELIYNTPTILKLKELAKRRWYQI